MALSGTTGQDITVSGASLSPGYTDLVATVTAPESRVSSSELTFKVASLCSGGTLYGGLIDGDGDDLFCWRAGSANQSCTEVCSSNDGVNDVSAEYADSQARCANLMSNGIYTPSPGFAIRSAAPSFNWENLGCSAYEARELDNNDYYFPASSLSEELYNGSFEADAKHPLNRRVCACNS